MFQSIGIFQQILDYCNNWGQRHCVTQHTDTADTPEAMQEQCIGTVFKVELREYLSQNLEKKYLVANIIVFCVHVMELSLSLK